MLIAWNSGLVALSVLVAVIGSLTALAHAARMRQSHGVPALVWMVAGGITLGMAIWSMHFIGMLAFSLPIAISYDLPLTVQSVLPAIAAALLGFYVLYLPVITNKRIVLSGLVMGAGISAMHYTGMAALKMHPAISYHPTVYAASIVLAIVASWAALLMMYRGDEIKLPTWARLAAGSLVMGMAISGMHYLAMQGLVIPPNSICQVEGARIDRNVLATMVLLASFFWFSGGFLAALFDGKFTRQNSEALLQLQEAHSTLEKSARRMAESMTQDLRESEQRMRSLIEGALDCIVMLDANGNIVEFNPAAERTFGHQRAKVIGKNLAEVIIPEAFRERHHIGFANFVASGQSTIMSTRVELQGLHASGREIPVELSMAEIKCSGSRMVAGFLRDITERKRSEEEIHNLAFYDALTKLPNRRLLLERLQHGVSAWLRNKTGAAILFMDIDNFKSLNDTHGHESGDELLIEVANRLQACVRAEDTVARLGGDEFVVMLGSLSDERTEATLHATMISEKIRASLARPYVFSGFSHHSTASIGVAMFVNQAGDDAPPSIDALLKEADAAMYQAKQAGGDNVQFFSDAT